MTRTLTPPPLGRILVVDDHAPARESVIDVLRCAGYQAEGVASAVEALPRLQRQAFDVVVTDLQMPGIDGLELIRQLQLRKIDVQTIMVTAHATIASAVAAMRHGAFDYLEKPFDASQLEQLVQRALDCQRLHSDDWSALSPGAEADELVKSDQDDPFFDLVGNSPAMQLFRHRLMQAAPTDETVLICGESGTGKELAARAVHLASRRANGPLVSLNCPALSPQLAESELFGHRRGAFTGADADRIGRFEAAAQGTILLDEITEIDLGLQAKLLRVLQQRTFEPVGSSQTLKANVRVIASTNRDLRAEVAAGRFREDLYYRLAVLPLLLPPLRDRGNDVEMLVEHFLRRASRRLQREAFELEPEARSLLNAYHWPGNVRELENLVTRACVLSSDGTIAAADLRPWLQEGPQDASTDRHAEQQKGRPVIEEAQADLSGAPLAEIERQVIIATLERFDGHRAKAAESLGIGVRTLSGKLRGYGYAPRARSFSRIASEASVRQNLPVASADSAGRLSDSSARFAQSGPSEAPR